MFDYELLKLEKIFSIESHQAIMESKACWVKFYCSNNITRNCCWLRNTYWHSHKTTSQSFSCYLKVFFLILIVLRWIQYHCFWPSFYTRTLLVSLKAPRLWELAAIKFSKPSKVVPVYRVGHTQTPLCKYSNIAYESEQVVAVLYPTDLVTCWWLFGQISSVYFIPRSISRWVDTVD